MPPKAAEPDSPKYADLSGAAAGAGLSRADFIVDLVDLPIALPGRKSVFRAGFGPDSNRGHLRIGPPAGLKPAGGPILKLSRRASG